MAQRLKSRILNPGISCSKSRSGYKVDSAFHHSDVDEMSTGISWGLVKKVNCFLVVAL